MFTRVQSFLELGCESCFFWGSRQTGKSTLLANLFPDSPRYDLLLSDQFSRLAANPSKLREELLEAPSIRQPVIIDEVQKIPALLDEIQWMMVNKKIQFILSGSSARKLKRSGANLLGGRALRYELFPLVSKEIPAFDLYTAVNNGLLPRHYLAKNASPLLQAYIDDYLKEEIAAEALTRNIPAFSRFLEAAAFCNGSIANYRNVAAECGVSPATVKDYFQILSDTLLGRFIPAYRKKPKRRVIHSPRFYFFDVGIANHLLKRGKILPGGENFGKAFEHLIFQEVSAYSSYSGKKFEVSYWRTASQIEVDFILGDHAVALEVKSSTNVAGQHLRGLKAFHEEYPSAKLIAVSLDPKPRLVDNIHILPWDEFLSRLWNGEII